VNDPFLIWRPVVGFEGLYSVSNLGDVRSEPRTCATKAGGTRPVVACLLRPTLGTRGYPCVTLFINGKRHYKRVHLLVLEAFIGPQPAGTEGAHNDGNPLNCEAANLRWDTHQGNVADKERHGTLRRGNAHARSKLSEEQVRAIRQDQRLLREIAAEHRVSVSCISDVQRGRVWRHVDV
jgi:hypothetical protein